MSLNILTNWMTNSTHSSQLESHEVTWSQRRAVSLVPGSMWIFIPTLFHIDETVVHWNRLVVVLHSTIFHLGTWKGWHKVAKGRSIAPLEKDVHSSLPKRWEIVSASSCVWLLHFSTCTSKSTTKELRHQWLEAMPCLLNFSSACSIHPPSREWIRFHCLHLKQNICKHKSWLPGNSFKKHL